MWILDELYKNRNSEKIAVLCKGQKIIFKDLWQKSETLAFFLKKNNFSNNPIIIYSDKDIDVNITIISSLKLGQAYVPVDLSFPLGRLYEIVKLVNAKIVFNFSNKTLKGNIINKSFLHKIYENKKEISKDCWAKNDSVCYILFTSGSTGKPKGIPIKKKI